MSRHHQESSRTVEEGVDIVLRLCEPSLLFVINLPLKVFFFF